MSKAATSTAAATASVVELIDPDSVPTVNLDEIGKNCKYPLGASRVGVWYLNGKLVEDLLAVAEAALAIDEEIANAVHDGSLKGNVTSNRGRRNINLHLNTTIPVLGQDDDNKDLSISTAATTIATTRQLQNHSQVASVAVSSAMEEWLQLETGTLSNAHKEKSSSVVRLLKYSESAATPPHADAAGYVLRIAKDTIEVQDPKDSDQWWGIPPLHCSKNGYFCILMIGNHLQAAAAGSNSPLWNAPIHRVPPARNGTIRRALTVVIKADECWPSLSLGGIQSKPLCTVEQRRHDFIQDSEQFSRYMEEKHVPTSVEIQEHWSLLAAIVEGQGKYSYRLPSIDCKGYWQLQTVRYYLFLNLHKKYGIEASGMLPPRAIHHVWMCHMLQPKAYKDDCEDLLNGAALPHSNEKFALNGCPVFHKLWKELMGFDWPSEALLRNEAENAVKLPMLSVDPSLSVRADFWIGYDGLASLYDRVCKEYPSLLKEPFIELNRTRSDYGRFMVASAYASMSSLQLTLTGAVDLVWHTHQTNPLAYHQAMSQLPNFLDHEPCGSLNPPNAKLVELTKSIWLELFAVEPRLGGHTIGCCGPSDEPKKQTRPLGLTTLPDGKLAWWFESQASSNSALYLALGGGLQLGVDSLPADRAGAESLIQHLALDTNPETVETILCDLKKDLLPLDEGNCVDRYICWSSFIGVIMFLVGFYYPLLSAVGICMIGLYPVAVCCFEVCTIYRWRARQQYEDHVESCRAKLEPLGLTVSVLWSLQAPEDPSQEYDKAYFNAALVFRSCNTDLMIEAAAVPETESKESPEDEATLNC